MKTEQILRIPYFLITELHILQIPLPQLCKLRPIILQSMKLMSDKTGKNEKKNSMNQELQLKLNYYCLTND